MANNDFLILGSLAYDSILTPLGNKNKILGGSANYATLAATFYHDSIFVTSSVGQDYSLEDQQRLIQRGVDFSYVSVLKEPTLHWKGSYKKDLTEVTTVNEDEFRLLFSQHSQNFLLSLKKYDFPSKYVFLANTAPHLQLAVLQKLQSPFLIALDTRDIWIKLQRENLLKLLKKVDILFVNEEEGWLLSQVQNSVEAADRLSQLGPKAIVIKQGEYGFLLYYKERLFSLPAFPLKQVVDTTGAGDVFAGAMLGFLAHSCFHFHKKDNDKLLRQACVYGNILASYIVEDFGMNPLEKITPTDIQDRFKKYQDIISIKSIVK